MDHNDFLADMSAEEDDNPKQSENTGSSSKQVEKCGRVIRRRARKACTECHKRKVRCDVLTRGQSCTNCRLDGLPCVIRPRDRSKRLLGGTDFTNAPETDTPLTSHQVSMPEPSCRRNDLSTPSGWQLPASKQKPLSRNPPFGSTGDLEIIYSYYGFLESDQLSHIPPEDFKFLENKGCFHLPVRSVLDEFVRHYFLYVHPTLPILDEGHFWDMYLGEGRGQRRISLFLFRAMLFVSCSYVSAETLKAMGFDDPVEARAVMFKRAKFLFDFEAILDPISISQAALLLSYYSYDREPLGMVANTTWLRTAIQSALSANVHLYSHDPSLTAEERLSRKRLWWCCVLRDRLMPLALRRPIQITHEHFDFTQEPLSESDLESEFHFSQVYNLETKRTLARILKAQLDLCIVLTDLISVVYPHNSVKSFDYNTLMLLPAKLQRCREDLDKWSTNQRHISPTYSSVSVGNNSISLFNGLTQVYHFTARAALCQYESFALEANRESKSLSRTKELGTELHSSIANISNIVGKLVEIDVAKYFPIGVVAYMALPLLLNSLDLQNTSFKNESKRRQLRLYNEAMNTFRARYTGIPSVTKVLDKSIACAKADIFSERATQPQQNTSTALLRSATNKIDDWFEIFMTQPRQYLRLALRIDISLCTGKFPNTGDLPRLLLIGDSTTPSIPRSLTPPPGNLAVEELPLLPSDLIPANERNFELDFFDFGTPNVGHKGSEAETSSWNGEMAEAILDDLMQGSYAHY